MKPDYYPPYSAQDIMDVLLKHSITPSSEPWFLRGLADRLYAETGNTEEGQKNCVRIRRLAELLDDFNKLAKGHL